LGFTGRPSGRSSPDTASLESVHHGRSIGVGRNNLAVVAGAEGPQGVQVDGVLKEPDRAVQEEEVPAPRVLGVEGGGARIRPVTELIKAILEFVEEHNNRTAGYRWKALPDEILAKVRRAREVLDKTPTT
jgi:hypothetical protein